MHRQIAGTLTGRVTKWIVLVAVLALTAIMASFSAKLTSVQNNEASSWLPESAESTQVLEELSETVDPNDIPTLVVYQRDGGLTEDDLAQIEADGPEIAKIDGVTDQGVLTPAAAEAAAAQGAPVPTLVSDDGEVAYLYFVLNFGTNGWNDIPDAADEIRGIATLDGGQVYLLAKYADLTVNGQSQAILSILVIGAGTDYALLLVARYREELRRHEDRHEAMAFAL